jgi:hypothetical protein
MGDGDPASGPYAFVPRGGGPVDRFEHRVGLRRGDVRDPAREAAAVIALGWLPLLALEVLQRLTAGDWDPLLAHFEVHVRPLVAAPLILVAGAIIGERARHGVDYLVEHAIVPEDRRDDLRRLRARAVALRDSAVVEVGLVVLAVWMALLGARPESDAAPLRLWHTFVSLPLYRYVLLRMLWRWLLWAFFLWRLSRLDLRLLASHPDRVGGLGPLLGPSSSFGMVVMAVSAASAASWATLLTRTDLTVAALRDEATAMVAFAILVAVLPLLSFVGPLHRLVRRGELTFGGLAARYCADFERKWRGARREDLLGTPDLQSLADLGGSYEVVATVRTVPVPGRLLARLAVAGVLPLVPLLLTEVPLAVLLDRILKASLV